MIEGTKISLSPKELELVTNREWILTKQIIIEKVCKLFSILSASMQEHIKHNKATLPEEAGAVNPKISRGENYQKLPYIMLDYPRHFNKESTLAIRTFFWWGNFFSISLQLSGIAKENAAPALKAALKTLQQNDYWICIKADPWQHDFEKDNYELLKHYTPEEFATMLHRKPFIKLAKYIGLQQWDAAPIFLEDHFNEMIMLLQINSPGDERDLSPGIPKVGFDL